MNILKISCVLTTVSLIIVYLQTQLLEDNSGLIFFTYSRYVFIVFIILLGIILSIKKLFLTVRQIAKITILTVLLVNFLGNLFISPVSQFHGVSPVIHYVSFLWDQMYLMLLFPYVPSFSLMPIIMGISENIYVLSFLGLLVDSLFYFLIILVSFKYLPKIFIRA
jgi:hypothetical protein